MRDISKWTQHFILGSIFLLIAASFFCAVSVNSEDADVPAAPEYDKSVQDSAPQCANLIKECFAHGNTKRHNCFFSAATHPFCDGTDLGRLASKRWSMSPNRPGFTKDLRASLGPHIVDLECLKNFDNQWSSALIEGRTSTDNIQRLNKELNNCKREISNELVRP
jgi:hypothetical protein